jgi:hypothetical protein
LRGFRRSIVALVVVLSACGGTGERACDLLGDLPERAEFASREQLLEVADAARESDVAEIRMIGQELTTNMARGQAFERLAPGLALDVIQFNLDDLRRACRDLGQEG